MKTEIDPAAIRQTLDRHRAEPDVSPETYLRQLRINLGESVATRRAVYLDTKYWIYLRDAHLHRPQHYTHTELLERLVDLVEGGSTFCPLSATTFLELLQQSVPESRVATAELVDTLSLGASLCVDHERAATEVAHFFHENSGKVLSLHPRRNLVWVRLPFVFGGFLHEVRAGLSADPWTLEKAFLDHLWTRDLTEIMAYLPVELPSAGFEQTAARLNRSNDAHAHALRSFEETYVEEIAGGLELLADVGVQVIEQLFEQTTGQRAEITPASRLAHRSEVHSLLVGLAKHGKAAKWFPTVHVHARCHAANRWDRRRRVDANDLHDFRHATAAIPYCHLFLTERGMRSFLTAGHMRFDRDFVCEIVSDNEDALACVRSLSEVSSRPSTGVAD